MFTTTGQDAPVLYVLAGVNGAGKSSIGGALLRNRSLEYYNPDEFAREVARMKGWSMQQANSAAWQYGKEKLEAAIGDRSSYAFETTLGGRTIPALLMQAAQSGHEVIIWFCGLSSPDLHRRRVAARVTAGGHDIPWEKIRERWSTVPANLIALLPYLAELQLFDNSAERDPLKGNIPPPRRILHVRHGRIVFPQAAELENTPDWARPIVEAAWTLAV